MRAIAPPFGTEFFALRSVDPADDTLAADEVHDIEFFDANIPLSAASRPPVSTVVCMGGTELMLLYRYRTCGAGVGRSEKTRLSMVMACEYAERTALSDKR
jgi:hypothetical protein